MATKSGLIGAVNSFITALITQSKHRDSMLEVINELYPTKVSDSNSTETYTTKNGTVITYSIQIVKQGRSVRINGSYTNTSALVIPIGTTIFTFKTNEFRGDTSYYLGNNVEYTPYLIKNLNPMLPNSTTNFSITINSDT
jgi:hypothetical protein